MMYCYIPTNLASSAGLKSTLLAQKYSHYCFRISVYLNKITHIEKQLNLRIT